ncbi:unnamed protein product [Mytilus coruscus]|uniref:Uncharacterized protein n=1 Tax=Mytilus coruscus TaxID=42192 RepID=A0A6J8B0Z1_MYTCO|nr:unnamed protein product [Mytilus coruscus]
MLEENLNLKQHVYFLENENEEMKERLEELMKNKEITTFENGKYNDTVREVYAVLLAANVGVKNVEHIVKTVLNKLGGVKIDRLPKKTFAEIMLVEAKALAQIQSVDAMINSDACTLHILMVQREKGREYGGLQVWTSSGQYSLGSQAEAALKELAKTIIVSDTLPSDSFSHSTPDFIRASTKLLEPDKKKEVLKIARENAPKMIKNYRKQKIVIKEKHIELLNKRKEENLRLQQNKIDELNKIRADVEKFGGEWKCQQEIADNLNNIAKSKKIQAALSHSSNETDSNDVSDLSVVYNFKLGDVAAIAYSDSWYPGQVEEIKDDSFEKVKCLHPTN